MFESTGSDVGVGVEAGMGAKVLRERVRSGTRARAPKVEHREM
jgi:hypothetical protein